MRGRWALAGSLFACGGVPWIGCAQDAGEPSTGDPAGLSDDDDAPPKDHGAEGGEAEPPPEWVGICRPACDAPADCCAPGVVGCPGEYPHEWSCRGGACRSGGCHSNEHCMPGGDFSRFECHPIGGVGSCFDPCADDSDCAAIPDARCSGEADDGVRFCESAQSCATDAACAGYGRCDLSTGTCRCAGDDDCAGRPGLICAD